MAALSSREASGSAPADRFRLLRELGARPVPTWAALESLPTGRSQLVVVERVARGGAYGDQEIADWVRDARRIATLEHPNVGRVRDVLIRGDEVLVASEYVDGVRWSELVAQSIPLELTLRVFLDILAGLSALHNLRDAKRQPLKLVHGELTPQCVIVGLDGVTRLVGACRAKSSAAEPGRSGAGYLAPEVLLADDSADARADLFSVGVMLWEALAGRPLFDSNMQASAMVTRVLGGHLPPAPVPLQYPWAAPLPGVVARALSADPQNRFASAPALAAELRKIAGPKLAPPSRLATQVRTTSGDRIRARREHLERAEAWPPEVSRVAPQIAPREAGDEGRSRASPSEAPTPVPPPPKPAPAALKAPPAAPLPSPATQGKARPPAPSPPQVPPPPPAPPTAAAEVAPVPNRPPALRQRLPTLNGLAPPAPPRTDAGPGSPVVVPSSNPPPPAPASSSLFEDAPSSVHLPAAPRLPSDLVAAALALPAAARVVAPTPPMTTKDRDEAPAAAALASVPLHRRRALLPAAIAGVLLLGVVVVRWAASGRTGTATGTQESTAAATASAPAAARSPASAAVHVATAPPPPAPPPAAPSAVDLSEPAPARPSAAPRPAAAAAAPPAAAARPAATPRRTKPKYEPEGI